MGLWGSITSRSGTNVSGPVREAAEIQRVRQRMEIPLRLIDKGLEIPVGRFSAELPAGATELRGKDIYMTPDTGVFAVHGGETLTAEQFLDLAGRGFVLINTTTASGYGQVLGPILAPPDAQSEPVIPPDLLAYDEGRAFGFPFERTPELRYLGDVLRLHAGVVKYLRVLRAELDAANRAYEAAEAGSARPHRSPFPWSRHAWSMANAVLPGIGFLVLGDPLNAIAWLAGVASLSYAARALLGGAFLIPCLVWLAFGIVSAQATYRGWDSPHAAGERPMTVVPIALAAIWGTDRVLLGGALAAAASDGVVSAAESMPPVVVRLLYGGDPVQYAVSAALFVVFLAAGTAVTAYDRSRRSLDGEP